MFPTSAIPGYPFGPQFFKTIIQFSSISKLGSSIFSWNSSILSKTTALPVCCIKCGDAADGFNIAPSGAIFPLNIFIPPSKVSGLSKVRITSSFQHSEFKLFSPIVFPLTVSASLSRISFSKRRLITAGIPPA